jgi:subtilisin family serine protease/subtilisin-like proprotein convertase family protein
VIDAGGSQVIFSDGGHSLVEVRLQARADPMAAVTQLAAQSAVRWAEPNFIFIGDPRDYTPNDPQYSGQYQHTKMQVNKAWDTQTGNPAIVVAIADDGVAINHPDLKANIWVNSKEIAGNGIDDDGNGFIDDVNGWDFSSGDANPNPVGGGTHGTHVAGIVAADTDNGIGVAGVAGGGPNGDGVRIMPIRWAGSGSWTSSRVSQSYTYAANNGAKIVNASYNFDGWATNSTVTSALNYSYSKGVIHFNSAGNNNQADAPRGVFDQILFVASTTSGDVKSSFSNYGAFVDISAPGSSVLATITDDDATTHGYGSLSGTSMSSPDAAGVAALIWSQNPTWSREQVVAQLLATADNIDAANPAYVGQLGTGRANAYRGVTETLGAPRFGAVTGLPAEGGSTPNLPASFTIDAPMRFDPATVTAGQFELRGAGPDGAFGTADDVVIPLTLNGGKPYLMGVGQLTFALGATGPQGQYRFRATSGGLRSPFNVALDGNGDGTAGDDFIRTFDVRRQVEGVAYHDLNADGVRNAGEPLLANRTVFADFNNNGLVDGPLVVNSTNVPVAIPDNATVTSTLNVSGFAGAITDINVKLNITHTYTADLKLELVGPGGQAVTLASGVGGSGDNFFNTVFDDQAAVAITAGSAPFSGTYRPAGKLSTFNGLGANGTWTLRVTDSFTTDTGTINSWSVTISSAATEPTAVTNASGQYFLDGIAPGTVTVRALVPGGWFAGGQPAGGAYLLDLTGGKTYPNSDFAQVTALPPTVTGVVVNDGAAQRSIVTKFTVSFSEAVSFPAGVGAAFQLVRTGPDAALGPVDLIAAAAGNTVTLTFADTGTVGTDPGGSLIDGRYELTVVAANVLGAGGKLDGNGDGIANDDYTAAFTRLFGDTDGDGDVDAADYGAFRANFGTTAPAFDFDSDGDVDAADFGQFRLRFGTAV